MRRVLLAAAALLAAVVLAAVLYVYCSQHGPGLDREAEKLAEVLEVRPGMTLADIGAGDGHIARRLAEEVGASGRIYATELDPAKLAVLRSAPPANMTVVEAAVRATGLPDACCDIVYMRRVYHHFADAPAMNRALYAAVKPGGRLAIVDMQSPRWLVFIHHGIPRETILQQVPAGGFVLERRIDRWFSPVDYCLVFRKPLTPAPGS